MERLRAERNERPAGAHDLVSLSANPRHRAALLQAEPLCSRCSSRCCCCGLAAAAGSHHHLDSSVRVAAEQHAVVALVVDITTTAGQDLYGAEAGAAPWA